jgi:flagellar basal body P-ring formation protein FlgA
MLRMLRIGMLAAFCLPAGATGAENGAPTVFATVKVTAYAGDTITAEVVKLVPAGQLQELGNAITDKENLIGKIARRTLPPGQPIPKSAIREPFIIQQGKTVALVFQSGNISITGIALALESGSAGDAISARNPDSGTVIRGVIQADGSLRAQ